MLKVFEGVKPSGKEVKERRSMIKDQLEALFVKQEGYEVKKDLVLSTIGLPADSSALLTRTIKSVFRISILIGYTAFFTSEENRIVILLTTCLPCWGRSERVFGFYV